jgi:hypothetical protein
VWTEGAIAQATADWFRHLDHGTNKPGI